MDTKELAQRIFLDVLSQMRQDDSPHEMKLYVHFAKTSIATAKVFDAVWDDSKLDDALIQLAVQTAHEELMNEPDHQGLQEQ